MLGAGLLDFEACCVRNSFLVKFALNSNRFLVKVKLSSIFGRSPLNKITHVDC